MMHLLFYFLCLFMLVGGQYPAAHPGAHSAIQHFSRQIEADPDKQAPYIQRGIAYSSDGKYEKALADFRIATQLGEPVVVSFDLGVLHYRMGEMDAARHYFDEYLQRFPNHAACLEYRARLLRDTGDYAASIKDFNRVFELQERPNPGHFISVAEMLHSSGGQGTLEALNILDAGNQKLGLTPQLQQYAIQLELQRNRPDMAVMRMHSLGPMLEDSPDWKVEMAALMLQAGQQKQARDLLDTASGQLESLRKTPARLLLQDRIKLLRKKAS